MAKIKVVQRKAKPQLLHEFNQKGQHRLVMVGEEGNETSRWFEHHEVGVFRELYFSAGSNPFGMGVFRRQGVEARVLPHEHYSNLAGECAQVERQPSNAKANRIRV